MPSKTVKLQTNLPLIGTVSKAYFHHNQKAKDEGWAPQLKLVGTWDEEGEANVYLPLRLVEDMHKAGFLAIETGPEHDLYKVMTPNTRIKLLKEEDGTKKFIRFSFADAAQAPQVSPQATKPEPEGKEPLKDVIGAVTRFHLGCMALSAHNHVLLYTCPLESLDMNAVHAGAFTLMKALSDFCPYESRVTTFTEKQLKSIRDTLGTASSKAREISDYKDWPEDKPEEGS